MANQSRIESNDISMCSNEALWHEPWLEPPRPLIVPLSSGATPGEQGMAKVANILTKQDEIFGFRDPDLRVRPMPATRDLGSARMLWDHARRTVPEHKPSMGVHIFGSERGQAMSRGSQ